MRLKRMFLYCVKLILALSLATPFAAFANSPALTITATTPFPAGVSVNSTTVASYTVTNTTPDTNITPVNQTSFPTGSPLAITSNTCGAVLTPGATCTLSVTLTAPSTQQTVTGELRFWASPTANGARYKISVDIAGLAVTPSVGANGSLSPSGVQHPTVGSSITYTATPDTGYIVGQWFVDGALVQNHGTTYTLSNITTDHTITVNFYQITVTPSVGVNGSLSPSTVQHPDFGASIAYTATPDSTYNVGQWFLDGTLVQNHGTTYTLSNIVADHTVTVNFYQLTMTTTAGSNGSMTPSTANPTSGSTVVFTAVPDSGYTVDQWTVDGVFQQSSGTTFTLNNVTADHTVAVTFIQQFTVTPSAGSNGSISPSTVAILNSGQDSAQYTATPDSNYSVDKWYVDGGLVQTGGSTYQITNVTANKLLNVTFKSPSGISIAAGQDITNTNALLAISIDGATTWKLSTLSGIPDTSIFNTGTCVGSGSTGVCIGAGYVTSSNAPTLFGSTDSGSTWGAETVTNSQPAAGIYRSTACTGTGVTAVCVAVGNDITNSRGLIGVTSDGSNTWANVTSATPTSLGVYYGAACTGETTTARCIAVGQETSGSTAIVSSTSDGGGTFTNDTITSNPTTGILYGASCTGTGSTATCVAAGQNLTLSEPLIVQSVDGTSSWNTAFISGAPATGVLNDASCIDTGSSARCVVVGQNTTSNAPFVAVTVNNGTNWTAISSISGAPTNAVLNSVSCSGTGTTAICAAAGQDNDTSAPLIVLSTDGGSTWTTPSITSPPTNTTLSSISCTGTTTSTVCTAAGQDTANTDGEIIVTQDGGTTWTVASVVGLPAASDFNGSSSTGGTLKAPDNSNQPNAN